MLPDRVGAGTGDVRYRTGRPGSGQPDGGQGFGLFDDRVGGLLLLVGRVPVLAQEPLDRDAQPGAHVFAPGPVDAGVGAHRLHQLAGDQ